jgi:hypothetical protein
MGLSSTRGHAPRRQFLKFFGQPVGWDDLSVRRSGFQNSGKGFRNAAQINVGHATIWKTKLLAMPACLGHHATMTNPRHHFVAVIGGAISGSVAAEILADHGIRVAVFEQNTRPYGKIEDGLPRWHVEQRRQEYARIDARMKKPNVYFIPSTKLGRDFNLPQLFEWGFSAVILANGAWRDRELGVPEAEQYVGKGLVYQNPFIYWRQLMWSKCSSSKTTSVLYGVAAFRPACMSWKKVFPRYAKRTASSRKSWG